MLKLSVLFEEHFLQKPVQNVKGFLQEACENNFVKKQKEKQ